MRAWVFVVGLVTCSLLFYLSGTLTGYMYGEKIQTTKHEEESKKRREPSKTPEKSAIRRSIEAQINMQKNAVINKAGIPVYLP